MRYLKEEFWFAVTGHFELSPEQCDRALKGYEVAVRKIYEFKVREK